MWHAKYVGMMSEPIFFTRPNRESAMTQSEKRSIAIPAAKTTRGTAEENENSAHESEKHEIPAYSSTGIRKDRSIPRQIRRSRKNETPVNSTAKISREVHENPE